MLYFLVRTLLPRRLLGIYYIDIQYYIYGQYSIIWIGINGECGIQVSAYGSDSSVYS